MPSYCLHRNTFYFQVRPCPEPVPCYQPVLPCFNPQCPSPIIPKQRPICPRAPPCKYPCLPVCRSSCPTCELDPVTRRRPLIVHDSVFQCRPSGLPAECFTRRNPNVRYTVANYVRQVYVYKTDTFIFCQTLTTFYEFGSSDFLLISCLTFRDHMQAVPIQCLCR